jgi:hypothetical protein
METIPHLNDYQNNHVIPNCEVYLLSLQTYAIITPIGNLPLEPGSSMIAITEFA